MNYFPIVIRYKDDLEQRTIHKPEDVECGRPFRVIKTALDEKIPEENNCNIQTE